mmetsp:Transcript_33836/g.40540  ORF Transcript_33836/g.40540 Transcript_33836/m.40540 type:complete len:82 (-) Transcript_33836:114-359(-)
MVALDDTMDTDTTGGGESVDAKKGYLYVRLLILCGLIAFPTKQQQFFETYRKGLQIKVGFVAAIMPKHSVSRRSSTPRQDM